MMIKEEGGSVYEAMTQKKKKVKSTRSQTVIRIEKDHQSNTQAKAKVKKKKCFAEEDSDQLNLSKKKKVGSKLKKKSCSDNPVIIGSSSDSESVKEIKGKSKVLKKKSKKGQSLSLLTLENNQDSDQDLPKNPKTHSQENTVTGVKHRENVAQNSESDNVVFKKKKKKKKKERHVSSLALMEIQDSDHEVSNKNIKQNKTTLQENAFAAKKHRKNIVQNSDIMKKKKKKKDKHDSLSLAGNEDNNHKVSDENLSTRDFRKNQETNSQENTFISKKQKENIVQNSESNREVTKKKKKKKSKDISSLICEDNPDQSHKVSNKPLPRKKEARCQEKALAGKKQRENSEDDSEVTKKKKRKIQKEEEEVTESLNLLDEDGEVSEGEKITPVKSNRKNRKRKSKPMEDLTVDNVDEGLHENNNVHCDNKDKKRKKQGPQNSVEEPTLKKKKKITVKIEKNKNEAMECTDDVTIVEERKGNCDEINIDKVRRQALQEEIDRESGKTKVFRNKVEFDRKFGQWSTATFESSDQKTKFLKLMGGFKKGSASTQDPPTITEKPNMALNRKGEETLKQTLQMEFEKAINLKQHRGIGLGFQPIANKKVHVDIYASRSVKFDD